jgi:hypothetical protein
MIPDIDIHRSAWLMIRRYGDDAAIQAAKRADQLLETGDLEGMLLWWAINPGGGTPPGESARRGPSTELTPQRAIEGRAAFSLLLGNHWVTSAMLTYFVRLMY